MVVESSSGSSGSSVDVDDTVSSPITVIVLPLPIVPGSETSSGMESISCGLYVDISSSEYEADQSSRTYPPSRSFNWFGIGGWGTPSSSSGSGGSIMIVSGGELL